MYDLTNKKSDLSFNFIDWYNTLELAKQYGWIPKGTEPTNHTLADNWQGGYFSNDWQNVLPEDALNIARALNLAILDLPETDTNLPFNSEIIIDGESYVDLDELISDQEELENNFSVELLLKKISGKKSIGSIEKLIALCNEGKGFTIS